MPLQLTSLSFPPLKGWTISVPDGCVVGLIGLPGSGIPELLAVVGGERVPAAGSITGPVPIAKIGPASTWKVEDARLILIEHALSLQDELSRAESLAALERSRRSGAVVLLVTHDDLILSAFCDELWWLEKGLLHKRGHPKEVLPEYRKDVVSRLRLTGESLPKNLRPSMRRGDGRAELVSIKLLGESGVETGVWRSGEHGAVQVQVRFNHPVEDPVVGIMIRTRIGFEVYGTNTELEKLRLGPCASGDNRLVTFRFRCDLCPQEYTLTAASHDPDGVWHDWLEDAVAFSVVGERYTAGVANLRASVSFESR